MNFIILVSITLLIVAIIFFGYKAEKAPLKSTKKRNNTIATFFFLLVLIIWIFAIGNVGS